MKSGHARHGPMVTRRLEEGSAAVETISITKKQTAPKKKQTATPGFTEEITVLKFG